ncbi:MAG: hypothetical protein LKF48_10150 [Prevotella sp.]|jgi:predicted restriction endonuclease|nr:hypothetical protein [Prevotella sp.]MCH4183503.1 hypothetical protein [Prevotella sp.]MCH4213148.1 hypothetical protein [Prevotella sp.]
MMNLNISYYKNQLLSIQRGWAKGRPSNAKPLYILTIFRGLNEDTLLNNRFFSGEPLMSMYYEMCKKHEPNIVAAPFFKPYYHLSSSDFYHIRWKGEDTPRYKWNTPSGKFLRDNGDYAYFDDDLWKLLQDERIRLQFTKELITCYLKHKK